MSRFVPGHARDSHYDYRVRAVRCAISLFRSGERYYVLRTLP